MTLANSMAGLVWLGITLYALLGGADFGAGFWDLMAGDTKKGSRQRRLIERSMGPVWEANHVWLIFILVVTWTCFPILFGSVTSTLWIPFMLAALGIIVRGTAFVCREAVANAAQRRVFGIAFGLASIVAPYFFGVMIGAIVSGRVPVGLGAGNALASWWNPVSFATGLLAVAICAYLAAVYLSVEARRTGDMALIAQLRERALFAGVAIFAVADMALFFIRQEAPFLAHGLVHRGLPFVIIAGLAGLIALGALYFGRFAAARIFAVIQIVAIFWGWSAAQFPNILGSHFTIAQAASQPAVLKATLISLSAGAVILIPSLTWLYILFRRGSQTKNIDA